ncbi:MULTISPECIES: ATP-binding cassette domain-containing protein [unclassified Microbacterium]|uniref:ATP-binding cassette domain-containing protein n=1 Tax=unclassified Microbacterium TaxID=2609290 RepID=UPI000AFDD537|nr:MULTISPECIES: ATP-binding cassette domain-containing protein [unclassified Microbacterium]
MNDTNLLAVDAAGLRKSFGTVHAVDGVDLRVRPGEIVAFLGPNGAGKTSTIDMLLGLSDPDEGSVRVFGESPRAAIAHGLVSAVLQTGGLLKDITVRETLQLTASLFADTRPIEEVRTRAGIAGIAAASALHTALPGCRSLIVTTFGRPGYLTRAMRAGASGFVVKDTPAAQLADAVRRVAQGLRVVDPALAADSLAQGESPLTERETDVLAVARSGGSIADIAHALHLSEGTVRNHLSGAIGKTGARNRADAVRVADENGWL